MIYVNILSQLPFYFIHFIYLSWRFIMVDIDKYIIKFYNRNCFDFYNIVVIIKKKKKKKEKRMVIICSVKYILFYIEFYQ
jgi:hypothetical protein